MKYIASIDLHSNNSVLGMIDEKGTKVIKKKMANDLVTIVDTLEPFRKKIKAVIIESTFNWYWLVYGLQRSGYNVHLANPSGIKQYEGLKHTDDYDDAFHLANLFRLGVLPEGYIYPEHQLHIRDLLRKRSMMVRQRTANILSLENLYNRTTGKTLSSNAVKAFNDEIIETVFKQKHLITAGKALSALIAFLTHKIKEIEKEVTQSIKIKPEYNKLITIPGIGNILALTITLETGPIKRFKKVGNYSSYCRCVKSIRLSNDKKKGENNRKNGNKYLAWAFIEAANHAKRLRPEIQRFYIHKRNQSNKIVAIKATSHKLARAAYYVMKDNVDFDIEKAFGKEKNNAVAANHKKGTGH